MEPCVLDLGEHGNFENNKWASMACIWDYTSGSGAPPDSHKAKRRSGFLL